MQTKAVCLCMLIFFTLIKWKEREVKTEARKYARRLLKLAKYEYDDNPEAHDLGYGEAIVDKILRLNSQIRSLKA